MNTLTKKLALASSILSFAAGTAIADEMKSVAFVPEIVGIPYFNAMQDGGNKAAKDLVPRFLDIELFP